MSWLRHSSPAVVLGSTSPDIAADAVAPAEVVRRRSGGGVVWLDESAAWVDAFVPSGDPLWRADVSVSVAWLADALTAALADLGLTAEAHDGPYERGPADDLVCFGSLGPGEVTADGRKLVGVSQRRTREGARFQCVAYERFSLGPIEHLLDAGSASQIRARAVGWADLGLSVSPAQFANQLISSITSV